MIAVIAVLLISFLVLCLYSKTYHYEVIAQEGESDKVMTLELTYQPGKTALRMKTDVTFKCTLDQEVLFEGKGKKLYVSNSYEGVNPDNSYTKNIWYKEVISGRGIDPTTGKVSEKTEDNVLILISAKKDRIFFSYRDYVLISPELKEQY